MRLLSIRPLTLFGTVCLITGTVFSGCTTKQAWEGDPMPPEQVASFLQVISPRDSYDTPPMFKKGYAPFYPEAEVRKGHLGYAMAEFTINANGKVSHVRILKATTYNFGEEAGYTVRDWRFNPAKKNGQPVSVRARLPFTFRQS